MSFNVGDLVQLRSGSPVMTVTKCVERKNWCTWFDEGGVKKHAFPPESLELYTPPESTKEIQESLKPEVKPIMPKVRHF